MQVAGIIAEYNPFHTGHKYHLDTIRQLSGADYIIVVMSGNFTQRGAPALIHKYARAEMALLNGADLVLELPLCFSCASAEYFAGGAVALLDKLGVVNTLGFGSECGDVNRIMSLASVLNEEPLPYQEALRLHLKSGMSYPLARQTALASLSANLADDAQLLASPNNILGIEYCRALLKRGSLINPITIQRIGSHYHEAELGGQNSSALAIRNSLARGDSLAALQDQIPPCVAAVLAKQLQQTFPLFDNDFSALLHYKLLLHADSGYEQFADITPDLSDRICNHLYDYTSFGQFCNLIKTKDMTYTRVSRCLMHILLDITAAHLEKAVHSDYVSYARILGFRKDSRTLFGFIKNNCSIPLLSKLSEAQSMLDEAEYDMLRQDIHAAHIYNAAVTAKFGTLLKPELSQQIRII